MRLLKSTALAIAFISPAVAQAATDGTPGATSTGTFNATATVNPPIATQVQVFGLDDFTFVPIQSIVSGGSVGMQSQNDLFCLTRNTTGNVLVTVRQLANTSSSNYELIEDFTGYTLDILSVQIQSPNLGNVVNFIPLFPTQAVEVSGNGCNANSDSSVANSMIIKVPQTTNRVTNYPRSVIARFEISVAPQ